MSAKVYAFNGASDSTKIGTASPRIGSSRKKSSRDNNLEDDDFSTGSTKSPRSRGKMSRQSSFDEAKQPLSKQNSFQGGRVSRNTSFNVDNDVEVLDITDHSSGANSARGVHAKSSKGSGSSAKHRGGSSKSRKKRVSFSVPLVDPRPEKSDYQDLSMTYGGENSLSEDEFRKLQQHQYDDDDSSITPRRMKKRKKGGIQGKWRRYIPFGQYIPTLPSFFCSIF